MQLYDLFVRIYSIASKVARATKLIKPLRRTIGPIAGRFVYGLSPNTDRPFVIHGHKMFLATRGKYPPTDMAMDRYEKGTTQLFERTIEPGMVVIDVGAHVGYYTLLAARLVGPTGKVYAFEPEPANYALLLKNIELNGYNNVEPVRKAASNRVDFSTLFLTALDNGRHSTYRHGLPESGSMIVEMTTIDAFLEAEGCPRVDFIKMDVEGAELDVLQGMTRLIENSVQLKLVIEFNPFLLNSAGVAPTQLLNKPTSWSFKTFCIDEQKGLLPLGEINVPSLVDKLLASQSSVNLFCLRE